MPQSVPDTRLARAEAAAWLARLRAEDRSPEDEAAFRHWLSADPANAAAFDAVNAVWDCAGALDRDLRGVTPPPAASHGVSRRTLMRALGGALVLGGGAFAFAEYAEAGVYETDVGEQRHVALSDGTELMLDTCTRLRVRYTDAHRRIDLQYGRANFRVAPDGGRPFMVDAGNEMVTGSRSVFDVCRNNGHVSVILIQGSAAIHAVDGGSVRKPRVLSVGERLVAGANSKPVLDKPDLTPLLAWQTGEAIFENSSLADAIGEMNRYSTVKLEVDDARIAGLKVSGVYRVGDNASFARSLVTLLPIEAREDGDRIELSGDESRMREG